MRNKLGVWQYIIGLLPDQSIIYLSEYYWKR